MAVDVSRSSSAELASSLRWAVTRLSRRFRAERSDMTLGLAQTCVLSTLSLQGPLSPSTLAECERVQPSSITRIVDSLEESGLVTRSRHPKDRRQLIVSLTSAGEALAIEDRRRKNAWLVRCLETYSESERREIAAVLPLIERLVEFDSGAENGADEVVTRRGSKD